MPRVIQGLTLVPGVAAGAILRIEPLSLWGGFDGASGRVSDPSHPQAGLLLSGCLVCMPRGIGSSSSASVLAEALRLGTAPAALLLAEPDAILGTGALIAGELYDASCPVVVVAGADHAALRDGVRARVEADRSGARITLEG